MYKKSLIFIFTHFFVSIFQPVSCREISSVESVFKKLLYAMSRSVTMCHYMKSVKRNKTSKHGILKTVKVTLNDINQRSSMHLKSPLGLFGLLPREMRFRVFSFTPLSDLGQLSLSSRNFTEEVMKYIHNNDALLVIVPNIHLSSDEESSQLFVNWKTEYCWGHFRDLGKPFQVDSLKSFREERVGRGGGWVGALKLLFE